MHCTTPLFLFLYNFYSVRFCPGKNIGFLPFLQSFIGYRQIAISNNTIQAKLSNPFYLIFYSKTFIKSVKNN